MNKELLRRLERMFDAFGLVWLEGHVRVADAVVRLKRFGGVTAAAAPSRPDLDFMNRIHGLQEDPGALDEVLAFYRSLGIRPWVELPPGAEELAAHFAAAGGRPVGAVSVLCGPPVPPPSPDGVEVRRADPEEAVHVAEILLEGHGVPAEERAVVAPRAAVSDEREDVTFYVARVDGEDAAAAVLFLHQGVGGMANAATVPRFRRRGCQSALLAARIQDAADAGCDVIGSLTTFGSDSERNMERAGLGVVYTKTVWRIGGP